MKKIKFIINLFFFTLFTNTSFALVDIMYAVKSTGASTQDWGTIDPLNGNFTSIRQISPTGLGWPLGDIGSEPDPINGYVYTRQTNSTSSTTDILAIKKRDGTTSWLNLGSDAIVVGYDTIANKLVYRESVGSSGAANSKNTLKTYDVLTGTSASLGTFAGTMTSWQAGGIGAIDSFGRTAFQIKASGSSSTLYNINLDTGNSSSVTINDYITTIAWDAKGQKLYGIYDSNSNGKYRIVEIDPSNGNLTNIGPADTLNGMSNYVQVIAPNDQRYYVQDGSSDIRAISLVTGQSLGTFTAPLRLMPPGAIVLGDDIIDEIITYTIDAPDSKLIKLGANSTTYTGTNNSIGGVDIEAGTLKVSSSTNLGSGSVSLEGGELEISSNATITNAISSSDNNSAIDTDSNSITLSGIISGSSKINKVGTGSLTITGVNTNSAGIEIDNGTLIANGSGSMPVIVNSGILKGSGTIGNLTSSSRVEPGNSIGTLNVSGNVNLNSGSVLVIEIDTAGNNDKIIATGSVAVDGVLRISPASGTYTPGQQYTIITGSSISGTFSSITVLSCSGSASASYGSTDIVITLSSCSFNSPKNRETIKNYVNNISSGATGDLNTVINALNTLSGDNYDKAIDALDYNPSGAIDSVAQNQFGNINNSISQRLSVLDNDSDLSSLIALSTSSNNKDLNSYFLADKLRIMKSKGWWGDINLSSGENKSLNNLGINGFDFNYYGATVGYDALNGEKYKGFAFTFYEGLIDSHNSEGETSHKTFAISKYQSQKLTSGNNLNINGSFAVIDVNTDRKIKFASIDRIAKSNFNNYFIDGSIEYKYMPKLSLGFTHNISLLGDIMLGYQDNFKESGADSLNLEVNSKQTQTAKIGIKDTIYSSNKNNKNFIPFLSVGLYTSNHLGDIKVKQNFINQNSFSTISNKKNSSHAEISLGLLSNNIDNAKFNFLTKGKFSNEFSDLSFNFQYNKKF